MGTHLATFVEATNSLKYLPAAKPGRHYDSRSMRRKDLQKITKKINRLTPYPANEVAVIAVAVSGHIFARCV